MSSCASPALLVVTAGSSWTARTTGALQHYFSWALGQVWIDGTSVSMAEFSTKLDEAKARHRAEHLGAAIEERTRRVRKTMHDLGNKLKGLFK